MNVREIERIVGMIQTHIFKNSNAYSAGILKSHFRGAGLQFREHQIYVPGDDVRFIDWKLTARSTHTHIKTFEEERNVEIVVLLDLSPTLLYGFEGTSKLQAMIEIVALLYMLTGNTQDLVRVLVCAETLTNLPPKRGREGLGHFISMMVRMGILNENGEVNLRRDYRSVQLEEKVKLAQVKNYLGKRKEVIYLGDMSLNLLSHDWDKLVDRKNMHCFWIYSPIDKNQMAPFLVKTLDPTSGRSVVTDLKSQGLADLDSKTRFKEIGVQERYLERFIRELQ